MKNSPKKGEKKRTETKGLLSVLTNLWVAITILMLGLAREIEKVYKYALYYNVINNVTIRDKK